MNPEPSELIIGDSVSWTRRGVQAVSKNDAGTLETTDIKASAGWALKFTAVGKNGVVVITAAADTDNPDDFLFTAAASATAAYAAGDYQWQLVATKTTTRYTIAEGWITLKETSPADPPFMTTAVTPRKSSTPSKPSSRAARRRIR